MTSQHIQLFQLDVLRQEVETCCKCNLHKMLQTGCTPVFGDGNVHASIMLVGEALGENEMLLSKPFIGIAGNMLNTMLKEADIEREKCYVSNVVKCRPTDNGKKTRPPSIDEIRECSPYLHEEINIVRPQLIFTLGKIATYELIKSVGIKKSFKLEDVVGKTYTVLSHGSGDSYYANVIPNYHPSYIMQHGKHKMIEAVSVFKKWKEVLQHG